MMSKDSKNIYGRKNEVVDRHIDGGYDREMSEEDIEYQRNVCDSKDCEEFSVFVYDGSKYCFKCADREIAEDKRRRDMYKEMLVELESYWYGRMYDRDMKERKDRVLKKILGFSKGEREVFVMLMGLSRGELDEVKKLLKNGKL